MTYFSSRPGGAADSSRGQVPACRDVAPGYRFPTKCAPAGALESRRAGPKSGWPVPAPLPGRERFWTRDPGAAVACGDLAPGYSLAPFQGIWLPIPHRNFESMY